MAEKRDYYEVLGVGRGDSVQEIRKAYRRQARELHSDANREDPRAEERFKRLGEAFEVLGDPQKRAAYDRSGRAAVSGIGGQRARMKRFTWDWRNVALALAGIIIVALVICLATGRNKSTPLLRIGNATITDEQIVAQLKRTSGNDVLIQMASEALLGNYAEQQRVPPPSEGEIDQVINFQKLSLEAQGQDFAEVLEAEGLTVEAVRKQVRLQILQMRLVVPEEDISAKIEAEAKLPHSEFAIPTRTRIKIFAFKDAGDAKKALALFKQRKLDEALKLTLNATEAPTARTYIPGRTQGGKPLDGPLDKALENLNTGQYSQPFILNDPEFKGLRRVVQLVEKTPGESPTMDNAGIIVGLALMRTEQKYAVRAKGIFASALSGVDIFFYPASEKEYPDAIKRIKDAKVKNPRLPGAAAPPAMPGVPEAPAPSGR